MTKIGYGRIGSGTIGNPTIPTTGSGGATLVTADEHKKGGTATGASATAGRLMGVASRATLGTYVSDIHDRPVSVAGLGGGMNPLSFKLLARANRSWPGPAMLLDVSGRSRNAFSAVAQAWVGASRLSMTGGSSGFVSAPGTTAQAPQQPRIEAKIRLTYDSTTLIFGKWTGTAATSSYKLELINGQLKYSYSDGTTMASATSGLLATYNFPERTDVVVAAEHRNDGTSSHTNIRFFFSVDEGKTWRQFGGTNASGSTVNVAATTTPIKVGPGVGEIFWSRVRNSVNSLVLSEFDPKDLPSAARQWGTMDDLWTVANTVGALNPEMVQVGDVPDWGLNLNGDVLVEDTTLPITSSGGCSVSASVQATSNPTNDLQLITSTGSNTGRLVILMTSTGKFRAILGDNIFESDVVFGDTTVTIDFDGATVSAYANDIAMTQLTSGPIPVSLTITPSRTGDGSTDNEAVLFTGLAVTDRRLTEAEREFVTSILKG